MGLALIHALKDCRIIDVSARLAKLVRVALQLLGLVAVYQAADVAYSIQILEVSAVL